MSLPDKILIRKIRQREDKKLKLLLKKRIKNEIINTNESCKPDLTETGPHYEDVNTSEIGLTAAENVELKTSDQRFDSLQNISEKTLKAIQEMGFITLTEIQQQTFPHLLNGKHVVGYAKTGSGKTLAFLVAAVELIDKLKFKQRNGTGVIILVPTRELVIQTYGVLVSLMKYHSNTHGFIMGGSDKKSEARKLANGVNILVATPGRLLDHLQNTPDFHYRNLMCLVIDEVDRILEIGFEAELSQILNMLPKMRQSILFSATQTPKTEIIKNMIFKDKKYVFVEIDPDDSRKKGLLQGFLKCPAELRISVLYTILTKMKHRKIMVFFNSRKSVEYHYKLFNYINVPVMYLHGKLKQTERTRTFFQFSNAEAGTLLCTDMAARGLDIPEVDWIVHYDLADNVKEYIHRVGRTARAGNKGNSVLMVTPDEVNYLLYLKSKNIELVEWQFEWQKVENIQSQLDLNPYISKLRKEAKL